MLFLHEYVVILDFFISFISSDIGKFDFILTFLLYSRFGEREIHVKNAVIAYSLLNF